MMTKSDAKNLFGTTYVELAKALRTTKQNINKWPEQLDTGRTDRVLGAALRLNVPVPASLLKKIRRKRKASL